MRARWPYMRSGSGVEVDVVMMDHGRMAATTAAENARCTRTKRQKATDLRLSCPRGHRPCAPCRGRPLASLAAMMLSRRMGSRGDVGRKGQESTMSIRPFARARLEFSNATARDYRPWFHCSCLGASVAKALFPCADAAAQYKDC